MIMKDEDGSCEEVVVMEMAWGWGSSCLVFDRANKSRSTINRQSERYFVKRVCKVNNAEDARMEIEQIGIEYMRCQSDVAREDREDISFVLNKKEGITCKGVKDEDMNGEDRFER